MLFTKVYKEEDVRLRGCSYNVASVYFHLKNKRDYFKSKNNGSCYDLTKHISKNTGMCEKTIKRAIATLKKLGLISTTLKGKVNHYSFPILDAIENNTPIEEVIKDIPSKPKKKEIEQNIEDMGNLTNIVIVDGKAMIKEPVIETRSYSKAQIETIKQKLIDKNIPKQEPVTTTVEKPELSFQDFVNEYKYQIDDIIKDFADGTRLRRIQGEERLKSVINSRTGRYYKKQLMTLIENNVVKITA